MRLEIEEIDHDNVKSKLNAAVAKTTELQSEEKKRIVAQDNKLFSKYLPSETRSSNHSESKHIEELNESSQAYTSPSDIGKLNLAASNDVRTEKVEILRPTSSPRSTNESPKTSPRISPRTPANSYQFQRDWKTVKDDIDKSYEYLKVSDY